MAGLKIPRERGPIPALAPMFKRHLTLIIFMLLAGRALCDTNQVSKTPSAPLTGSTQALVVTTKGWDAVQGSLRRFARSDAQSAWVQVGEAIPIVVGRKGLGWGRGVNPASNLTGPVKKEGDKKSPAGIFQLKTAFGLMASDDVKWIKLPYTQLTDAIECVDDAKSAHYNTIVDRDKSAPVDWDSSEKMHQIAQYRLGIVVEHNSDPREPGSGSCVFIHIWQGENTGTTGCTAMAPENIETLLYWLEPAARPVLIQLPQSEYNQLQTQWQLPSP